MGESMRRPCLPDARAERRRFPHILYHTRFREERFKKPGESGPRRFGPRAASTTLSPRSRKEATSFRSLRDADAQHALMSGGFPSFPSSAWERLPSFPSSAWERLPRSSASSPVEGPDAKRSFADVRSQAEAWERGCERSLGTRGEPPNAPAAPSDRAWGLAGVTNGGRNLRRRTCRKSPLSNGLS